MKHTVNSNIVFIFAWLQHTVLFKPNLCVPCGRHRLGPPSPACLDSGDDVPGKCAPVCRWSSSCRPAQTGLLTSAGAPGTKPFFRWGVPRCLCCGPPGYDSAPDRVEAQGEEVGLCHRGNTHHEARQTLIKLLGSNILFYINSTSPCL